MLRMDGQSDNYEVILKKTPQPSEESDRPKETQGSMSGDMNLWTPPNQDKIRHFIHNSNLTAGAQVLEQSDEDSN